MIKPVDVALAVGALVGTFAAIAGVIVGGYELAHWHPSRVTGMIVGWSVIGVIALFAIYCLSLHFADSRAQDELERARGRD